MEQDHIQAGNVVVQSQPCDSIVADVGNSDDDDKDCAQEEIAAPMQEPKVAGVQGLENIGNQNDQLDDFIVFQKRKRREREAKKSDSVEQLSGKYPCRQTLHSQLTRIQRFISDLEQKLQRHDQMEGKDSNSDIWKRYHAQRSELLAKLKPLSSKIANLKARKRDLEQVRLKRLQDSLDVRKAADKLQKFIGFADERGLDAQIRKIESRLTTETLTFEEEALCLQRMAELKERHLGMFEYKDVTEVSVDRDIEEELGDQIAAIEEVMFCQFEDRIKLEDQFWLQIKQRDGVDVVVAKHIAENASIQKKIADKLQEGIRLRDVLRWQQSKYWESKGNQTRPYAEAFSMMAIDKVVATEDKGKEVPVPPPPWPAEREVVNTDDGSCQKACSLDGCSCEGFRTCIGRSGHQRRPHRCSFLLEVGSTSSSSHEPVRASIEDNDGTVLSSKLREAVRILWKIRLSHAMTRRPVFSKRQRML
jgi:hypothetical protein